jgi:ribosome maturation factor RimP
MSIPERIRNLLEPTVEQMSLDLVAVEWLGRTNGMLLRLSIDGPQGITARICAKVSRAVSPILDEEDPISGRYTLEVSSPGIKRPVQRPKDFERFKGHTVKIRLESGPPRRRYTGVIKGFEDGDACVEVDGEDFRFPADSIERAHLVLTLEQYQELNSNDIKTDEELVQ